MSVDVENDPNQNEKEKNMTMQERNTRNEINQMKQNMKSTNQEEDIKQNSQSNKEQQGNQEKEEIEGIEENKEKEEKTPEESMFENSDSEEEDVFNVKTSTWGPPTIFRGLHTLLGLAPATDYTFAMRAHNAAGWSPLSQEVNVRKERTK